MSVLVAITGGSGSGKTTLANGLAAALAPGAASLLSEDWYYHDCAAFPNFDPSSFDFDDIRIRDHDLLVADLKRLKAGSSIQAPIYDFTAHARSTKRFQRVEPAPVLIAEGAHLLCSEAVAALFDLRVYLDAPDDVRFIRRLLRDQAHRGRTARSVIDQYLATVRPAHLRLTLASKERADIIVCDASTSVEHPDPEAVAALVEPLIKHPLFAALRRGI